MDKFKRIWIFLFIVGCFYGLTYYFFSEIINIQIPVRFSPTAFIFVVINQVIFIIVLSSAWKGVVGLFENKGITLFHSYLQLGLVTIGKYLPGKLWGMFARGLYMARGGIQKDKIFMATVYEQVLLLHAGLVLSAIVFAFIYPNYLTIVASVLIFASIFIGNHILNLLIISANYLAKKIKKNTNKWIYIQIGAGHYIIYILKFMLVWMFNGAVFIGIYYSFFESTFSSDIVLAMLFANTVSISLGFFAIFAPGGIGVREAISSGILFNFIPLADAVLLSLLFRLWTVLMDAINGLVLLIYEKRQLRLDSRESQ